MYVIQYRGGALKSYAWQSETIKLRGNTGAIACRDNCFLQVMTEVQYQLQYIHYGYALCPCLAVHAMYEFMNSFTVATLACEASNAH